MKVRVLKTIFDGARRIRKGQIINISEDEKGDWFEKIDAKDTSKSEKPKAK